MRRVFVLPEVDAEHLKAMGLEWETIKEGNIHWLLIYKFPVPSGFNVKEVTLALMIQPGYPVAQLDMAYFYPHLQLLSQKQIGALSFQPIEGKVYQRWSRHRTPTNPWRPGIDDLSTHLASVLFWFDRELNIR